MKKNDGLFIVFLQAMEDLSNSVELLETGIKVMDLICPFAKGNKVGLFGGASVGIKNEYNGIYSKYCN